jgi:hypothetical protein
MPQRKKLAAYTYSHEAEMARELLDSHGIKAAVTTDDGGGNIPGQSFIQGHMVFVSAEDFDRAQEILNQSHSGEEDSPSWKCSKCGETIESQFTECWNCGTGR